MKKLFIIFVLILNLSVVFSATVNPINEEGSENAFEQGSILVSYFQDFSTIILFFAMCYSAVLYMIAGNDIVKKEKASRNLAMALIGFILFLILPQLLGIPTQINEYLKSVLIS